MSDIAVSIVVTNKNRTPHFRLSFPFLVSQYGVDYRLVYVDFHSNDGFEEALVKEDSYRRQAYSPHLKAITCIRYLVDMPFSVTKARNLGASLLQGRDEILAFSDIDTFPGMSYLRRWSEQVIQEQTFVVTRVHESRVSLPRRLAPEVNYGNFLVHAADFFAIGGFDETRETWGGEDDEVFHRLKLRGLREINPSDAADAQQFSLLHGDRMRNRKAQGYDQNAEFEKIYASRNICSKQSRFLTDMQDSSRIRKIFERSLG